MEKPWDCTWRTLGNTLKSLTCSFFTGKPALTVFGLSTAVSPHLSPFSRGSTSVRATLSCHSGSPGLFNTSRFSVPDPFISSPWTEFSSLENLSWLRELIHFYLWGNEWSPPFPEWVWCFMLLTFISKIEHKLITSQTDPSMVFIISSWVRYQTKQLVCWCSVSS